MEQTLILVKVVQVWVQELGSSLCSNSCNLTFRLKL